MNAAAPTLASRPIERRRHSRVKVALLGRYMLQNRSEYPCQSVDMSVGGLMLTAPVRGRAGERIIVYLEHIGRVEGDITRVTQEGFAMTVMASPRKREKLAAQLTWLANRASLGLPEDRRHDRVQPKISHIMLTLADSSQVPVKLLDMSLSGAAFSADVKLMITDLVMLGKTQTKVMRKFDGGYAVEFRKAFAVDTIDQIDL
ncbi:MAG: PilZ domain-containing protein [Hyphomicrobiales bacterium]|nr:PilZ domain-containing protein [Hyphomicrobiales bacterium]